MTYVSVDGVINSSNAEVEFRTVRAIKTSKTSGSFLA